jgi:beta-glucosidase/6-phospho-beta-glucosidase/beta-galactosidase
VNRGDGIGTACTINEPNIVALMGHLIGFFPARDTSWAKFVAVDETMRASHAAMRDALKAGPGSFPVGLALLDERARGGRGRRRAPRQLA